MKHYPPLQIVDEHDVPTGGASLDETYTQSLRHRVVYIICEDPDGRILLQKRGPDVALYPNCWDVSAAGHVDEGETYERAAERELEEELGVSGFPLRKIKDFYSEHVIDNWRLRRFNTAFKVNIPADAPLQVNRSEVIDTAWLTLAEVKQLVAEHPDQVASGIQLLLSA